MKGTSTTTDVRSTLPLSALILSPRNVRRHQANSIDSMAASIRSLGVIQNLAVIASKKKSVFEVIVGGRRLKALQLLRDQGAIAADYPVPYVLRSADEATEVSLAENVQREAMHPADEFDAFNALTLEGRSIDQIADAFGVTALVVERRLLLAKAAPTLLAMFRDNALSTDQLIALCSTDDHALQASAWANANSWNRDPQSLRRLVTRDEIDADDERVTFIGGVAAFEAAGGEVRRDLFSTDGQGGFLRDVPLLEKLVGEKLETAAQTIRDEGWSWVEVHGEFDYQAFNRFGRVQAEAGPLPDAAATLIDQLTTENAALLAEYRAMNDGADDYTQEQSDRLDAIEDRRQAIDDDIEAIQERHAVFNAVSKHHAGAWVCYDRGSIRIERGLVRAEDRKSLAQANADVDIEGGRETKAAGRKDNALSDALRRSLLGRRNHAAQLAVASNPRVAKILLAAQLVVNVIGERRMRCGGDSVPCDLALTSGYGGARTGHPVQGEDAPALDERLSVELKAVAGKLPKKDGDLWDALASQSDGELDAIIAIGVGAAVSLEEGHRSLTAKLLDALDFDVAGQVAMTADSYFNRVPKTLILTALKEAGLDDDLAALEKMKKGALATEAERRMRAAGSTWMPKLIRTPTPKPAAKKAKKAAKPTKQAGNKAARKSPAKTKAKKASKR